MGLPKKLTEMQIKFDVSSTTPMLITEPNLHDHLQEERSKDIRSFTRPTICFIDKFDFQYYQHPIFLYDQNLFYLRGKTSGNIILKSQINVEYLEDLYRLEMQK